MENIPSPPDFFTGGQIEAWEYLWEKLPNPKEENYIAIESLAISLDTLRETSLELKSMVKEQLEAKDILPLQKIIKDCNEYNYKVMRDFGVI